MASHQSNSQNNETIQTPTEHQTSSAIQTGRRNIANIYLIKVIDRNTRKRCETPEPRCSGIFIVNFEHISHLFLVFCCRLSTSKY